MTTTKMRVVPMDGKVHVVLTTDGAEQRLIVTLAEWSRMLAKLGEDVEVTIPEEGK